MQVHLRARRWAPVGAGWVLVAATVAATTSLGVAAPETAPFTPADVHNSARVNLGHAPTLNVLTQWDGTGTGTAATFQVSLRALTSLTMPCTFSTVC